MSGFAWVTLATNDSYSLGALVLAHSLKQAGTAHQLVVLVTPGVTSIMRQKLEAVFNLVQEVNTLDSKDEANLRLLRRPELGITFTKLHCWRLVQFEKCVFLDADTLVLSNSDELFQRDEFSAAPDVGWPDCFNSGVFVYKPSNETYDKLVDFALQKGSFDGGDQGLLNLYFSDWAHKDISKHLPFIYNMCSTATYSYLPAFKQYGKNAKIVHFIGPAKPWLQYFDTETCKVYPSSGLQHMEEILQKWWSLFCSSIHSSLTPDMSGLAGAFAQFTLGAKRTPTQDALENHLRRQAWEVGNIDYLGRDSFDNIWSKICESLSSEQPAPPTAVGDVPSADPTSITTPVEQVSEKIETPVEAPKAPEPTAEAPQAPTEVTEAPKQAEATIEPTPQLAEPPKPEEVSPVAAEPVASKTEAPVEEKKEELAQPKESAPVEAAAPILPPGETVPEVLPTPTEPQTAPETIPSEVPQSTEAAPPATTEVPPAVIPTESPQQEVPSAPATQPEQPTSEVTPEVIQAPEVPKSEATEALPATEAVAVAETPKTEVTATEPVPVEAQIPEAVATEPIVAETQVAETPKPEPTPAESVAETPKPEATPAEPVAAEPPKPEVTPEAPKQEVPTETTESSPVKAPKPEVTEVPTEVPQPTEVKPEVTEVPAEVPQATEVKPEEPVAVEVKPDAPKAEAPAIIPEAPKVEPEAPTEAKVEVAVEATPEVAKPAEETEAAAQEPAPKAEGAPKKKIVKKVKKVVKPEGAPKEGSSSAPEGAATPSGEGEEAPPTPPPRKTTTVKKVKAKKP